MNVNKVKPVLTPDLNSYIDTTNCFPLHLKDKLNIITRYVYSKVRWYFSIYKLGKTGLDRTLIPIFKEYVKR